LKDATRGPDAGTVVTVVEDGRLLGTIELTDEDREGAREAVARLRGRGTEVVILSGDAEGPVQAAAERFGITGEAGLTPEDKVARIEAARKEGLSVAFVGDGLNDGPALAAADLGIAIDEATDVARAAAAVTLLERGVDALPELFVLTDRARRIILQNLSWAVLYNAIAIPAALLGYVHPAIAAVAMALSSISVVLNAARLARGVRQSSVKVS